MELAPHRHPLQRMPSPSRQFSALLHALGLLSFAGSFRFLLNFPNAMSVGTFKIIGLGLATMTFICGILADLTGSTNLFISKNLLSVASAPMEVLISILYWSISAIDPALLLDPRLPSLATHVDLGMHLAPAAFLFIDLMFFSPPWTIRPLPIFGLTSTIAIAYWLWINYCFSQNKFYPYPLFELLDTKNRALLFSGSAIVMGIVTLLLKRAYSVINGLESTCTGAKPKTI